MHFPVWDKFPLTNSSVVFTLYPFGSGKIMLFLGAKPHYNVFSDVPVRIFRNNASFNILGPISDKICQKM